MLFEVLHIFTQVEVQLLNCKMTQVKVESLPFIFYSSERIQVHEIVCTLISKVQSIFCPFLYLIKYKVKSTEI